MSSTEATQKQLNIKVGVVKRYQKDLTLYGEEVVENKKKLESATTEGEEESWEVRNAKSLIRESENMIRDTASRLERALGDLGDLVNSVKGNADLEKNVDLLDAEAVLATAASS